MVWADGYFVSTPTRYGVAASQLRAFIDTLGPIWQEGKLANKTFTAATSAQNVHGGQEHTILSLYTTAMHWGAIVVPPGYADPVKFEDGGNPYGFSTTAGGLDDTGERSVAFQARRLVEFTAKLT
jgi:NAD(P)H dehydrogenase (quinone)